MSLTDEQIDAVFKHWAGANNFGYPYLTCYQEQFRHIAREVEAAVLAEQPKTEQPSNAHLAEGGRGDVRGDTGRAATESDRALLELAAKATGIGPGWIEAFVTNSGAWNPLSDSGQALELAVKLRLNIRMDDSGACIWASKGLRSYYDYYCEHPDAAAATRRAIVRAAAEIGRGL